MSRRSNPLVAALAAGCLVAALAADLFAQTSAPKKKTAVETAPATRPDAKAPAKSPPSRGSGIQQAQGAREPLEAPPLRSRGRAEPAEEAAPRSNGAKAPVARPKAEPLVIQKLTPELEKILKDWEAASSKFQKLSGEFTRYKYDHTYEIEFRAVGNFAYAAPDRGAYLVVGAEIPEKEVSNKKSTQTKLPYELSSDDAERWVCTGQKVLKIDDKLKQYEEVVIPEEDRGENMIDGPLPFLFGMKAEQAKKRYTFELLTTPKEAEKDSIWLRVMPLLTKDSVNWSKARIGISRKTWLPIYVNLTDPSGNIDTAHLFKEIEINGGKFPWFPAANPFEPNLKSYKKILNDKPAVGAATRSGAAPGAKAEIPAGLGARAPAAGKAAPATADRSRGEPPRTSDAAAAPTKKTTKAPVK